MMRSLRSCAWVCALAVVTSSAIAQDRLKAMPGYDQNQKMRGQIPGSVKTGAVSGSWVDEGKAFEYRKDGKRFRFDVSEGKATEQTGNAPAAEGANAPRAGRRATPRGVGGFPERGRQFTSALSPDGTLKAFYRDRNLWLGDPKGAIEIALTTDGNDANRVKSGTATWVYGEDLNQNTAMWWSPDSKKLAYYRFDEKDVKDYYLTLGQTQVADTLYVEPYVKVGAPNPVVDLFVYDVVSKKTTKVDVRDGKPFDNAAVGHYVYGIAWTEDGKELLFHRTNRKQNIMELTAADPDTGKTRVVVREEWPASWVENTPDMRFLKDGKRFLWASERSGFKNLYLYNLDGTLEATVTDHPFEVANIVRIDEEGKTLDYMAHSGDNPMKLQLHRVGLDGKGGKTLTDPAFHHSVNVSPTGGNFVDVAETHDTPPVTRVCDADGKVLATLAESDLSKFDALGLKKVELLTYKAADGKTDLYGLLHKPSNFDPSKKYPVLVTVYGGPATNGARESFLTPSALTEYGFLVASLDSRSAAGRGKTFLDAIYQKLGIVEIDDQAEGVKSLWSRPYVDKNRVGIFGTSYGGTASALCLLRYPEVFQAACASSAVTDFRNYDSIYAERYMGIPQENKAAFDAGAAMTYAANLKGRLMIFYGTADDNVHPSNSLQLIKALQDAGKSFEVQVGPDQGHASLRGDRMMEFFIEALVLDKPVAETSGAAAAAREE